MQRILIDSGFFFALVEPRDPYHSEALDRQYWLDMFPAVLPWPILYETINTRLVRDPDKVAQFERLANAPETEFVDDSPYRDAAYEDVIARAKAGHPLSLVDAILHSVITDPDIRVDAMLTFNLRDFSSVCSERRIEIL